MQQVAEAYGFTICRNKIKCPFHNDKTASLHIYEGDRGWYCHACQKGGSIIDFVMEYYNIDLPNAYDKLVWDFRLTHLQATVKGKPTPTPIKIQSTHEQRRKRIDNWLHDILCECWDLERELKDAFLLGDNDRACKLEPCIDNIDNIDNIESTLTNYGYFLIHWKDYIEYILGTPKNKWLSDGEFDRLSICANGLWARYKNT